MSKLTKALTAAAGNAGGDNLYVEDVFSTYLYTGNSSTQTITNGIDLDGEGGMLWLKPRNQTQDHIIFDTVRGVTKSLTTNNTTAEYTATAGNEGLQSFNNDGFTTKLYQNNTGINNSSCNVASWTFRKAENFFDVVTWTGDGASSRTITHNLNGEVGLLILKRTDNASSWSVYHKSLGVSQTLLLENTTGSFGASGRFGSSAPTTNTFDINNIYNVSGATYVAYLFASDAGGFGDDGDESIIKCGSVATNWAAVEVNLGFEPQFVIAKVADRTDPFRIFDNMRGVVTGGDDALLRADQAYYEDQGGANDFIDFTSTGFIAKSELVYPSELIYIAIRRPMKTPESGTEVFAVDDRAAATPAFVSNFPVDLYWTRAKTGGNFFDYARLRGDKYLQHDGTDQETDGGAFFDSNTGVGSSGSASTNNLAWMFKRATGFMDVVCYTGTGSARTIAHNLGVAPSMVVIKRRDGSGYNWPTWHSGYSLYSTPNYNSYMNLDRDSAITADATLWNSTLPTESVFSVGNSSSTNQNNGTYVAYLFGEIDGISKFGSYTGTGSNIDIDCGFSAGARFILIKRLTPGSGDWFVFDTFRGIVAGNDPYLYLNTGTAENSGDYIDPLASGFTITSGAFWININTYKYIYWAIA